MFSALSRIRLEFIGMFVRVKIWRCGWLVSVCLIILPINLGRVTLFMLSSRQKDIAALKAISQNLMHSNLSITDGVYAILSDLDVKNQIQSLGKNQDEDILQKLRELLNGF